MTVRTRAKGKQRSRAQMRGSRDGESMVFVFLSNQFSLREIEWFRFHRERGGERV